MNSLNVRECFGQVFSSSENFANFFFYLLFKRFTEYILLYKRRHNIILPSFCLIYLLYYIYVNNII